VDGVVAVLRLLPARALTRQVPLDGGRGAHGVPPAAGERRLDRHDLGLMLRF
jgi:hypothetical protein